MEPLTTPASAPEPIPPPPALNAAVVRAVLHDIITRMSDEDVLALAQVLFDTQTRALLEGRPIR